MAKDVYFLWYSEETFDIAIKGAVERYMERYGVVPRICRVNPSMLSKGPEFVSVDVNGCKLSIEVCPSKDVLKDYYRIDLN